MDLKSVKHLVRQPSSIGDNIDRIHPATIMWVRRNLEHRVSFSGFGRIFTHIFLNVNHTLYLKEFND
jgi:hypothetical protein